MPLICFDLPQIGSQPACKINVLSDQAAEHFFRICHDGIEIEDPGFEHLLSAKRQELAGQRGGSLPGLYDFLGGLSKLGVLFEACLENFPVAKNHPPKVVEVRIGSTCKLTYCFLLLQL